MKMFKKMMAALFAVVMTFGVVSFNTVNVQAASTEFEGYRMISSIFPDPVLARTVANQFGTNNINASVTWPMLNNIKTLRYVPDGREMPGEPSPRIYTLEGIEYLNSLVYLFVLGNSITDITPVASLRYLWYLNLMHNQISDLSPFASASMPWLREFYLRGNPATDYSPIEQAYLPSLQYLIK